jgi:L,D-transpeptidase ErfK/SrfK
MLLLALGGLCPGAAAETFALVPGQALVGSIGYYTTQSEDTLLDVARNNDLGYGQLITANSDTDPWLPGAGREIILPGAYILPAGPRKGIVIDLAAQRLYFFSPDGKTVDTYPIGTGDQVGMTPQGTTHVVAKTVHPAWYPPSSIRAERPELPVMVPPGPDNPLGDYALRLGWAGYLIHGTSKPYGVGRNVSHGCIRLYPEDIEKLFRKVSVGTPVRVIDEEMRFAWSKGELYLALAPSHDQIDDISQNQPMRIAVPPDLASRVTEVAGPQAGRIDWQQVEWIADRRPGVPIAITETPPAAGDGAQ